MPDIRTNLIRYTPHLQMNPHVDGCRRLSILLAGGVVESHRGRDEAAEPGSVALKAPRFDHHNRFGSQGATILSAILPDDLVKRLGVDAGRLPAWQWHHGNSPSLDALRLAAAILAGDGAPVEHALRQLLGGFSTGTRSSNALPPALDRLRNALHTSNQPPSIEQLAEREGMHPSSLGRSFCHHFGLSITRYRQRLRVTAVAQALLRSRAELVDIALDHGFADLSHMTRLFRRELGLPPGAFRKVMSEPSAVLKPFKTEWSIAL